jgi:hypothetical protein
MGMAMGMAMATAMAMAMVKQGRQKKLKGWKNRRREV